MGQEQRRKSTQRQFVNQIIAHAVEFIEFHKKKNKILKKRAFYVKQSLEKKEKKQQQIRDRYIKKRIQLLQDQNIEEYLKEVQNYKNERILHILDQTNTFLQSLGAKVQIQQSQTFQISKNKDIVMDSAALQEAKKERKDNINKQEEIAAEQQRIRQKQRMEQDKNQEEEGKNIISRLKQSTQSYISVTRQIKQEVKEQPKMLVGGTLKNYQLIGLQWLVSLYNNNLNGILADQMGLGKTIQCIALLTYLIEKKNNEGPFLLVVPLTTLSNWKMQFQKWAPRVHVIIYKGSPSTRSFLAKRLRSQRFNVVLTTYQYVMKDKSVLAKFNWQYIIVDQGHRMKNSQSKFAMTLGQQYQSAHRVLLTGTPLQNDLGELWALLNFLLPKIFGSCDDFKRWFNQPFAKVQSQKVELNQQEQLLIINRLHQVLQPFLLRRVKKEVQKELPDKQEYVIKVQLSGWQRIVYDQISKYKMMATSDSKGTKSKTLQNKMMQWRKICNHPYLFLTEGVPIDENIVRSSGKFELLDRMLPKLVQTGHKTLIFSQMVQLLDILQAFLQLRNISFLRLDGSTKDVDREKTMHLFNQKNMNYPVFLLSTRAGGQGLNLQAADSVIIFDLDWNPAMDIQAEDRAHRIGQQREVRVYRLVTKTYIEKEILDKAGEKKMMDQKIIQAGLFNTKADQNDRRKRLQQIFEHQNSSDDEGQEDQIPNDEQINEMIARTDQQFQLFQKIDKEMYERQSKEQRVKELMKLDEVVNYLGAHKKLNYRLLYDHQVPTWVKQIKRPKQMGLSDEDNLDQLGFGKRQRKQVKYDDGLTDLQFSKIIESGKDIQAQIERRHKSNQVKQIYSSDSSDQQSDSDQVDQQDDEEQDVRKERELNKRGLRGSLRIQKRSNKSGDDDSNKALNDQYQGIGRKRKQPERVVIDSDSEDEETPEPKIQKKDQRVTRSSFK